MPVCADFSPEAPFAVDLLRLIDCRVETLGEEGYLTLAGAGSPVSAAFAGLLTIAIALLGYRLLLGERLEARDGLFLALRIGIVLALATQWPAYQALVYRVVIDGPTELAGAIAGPIGGTRSGMAGRVQAVWQGLDTIAHPPLPTAAIVTSTATAAPGQGAAPAQTPPQPAQWALGRTERGRISAASLVLLVSSMGGLIAVRVVAGLLLALGPLFVACLLFGSLRGLFEGWVRGLAFAALGNVAVTVVLGMELAVLEPQALAFASALGAGAPPPGAAGEMFATVLLFGFAVIVALAAVARVAAGFRLPVLTSGNLSVVTAAPGMRGQAAFATMARPGSPAPVELLPPSRAAQLAETLRISERRDTFAAPGRRVAPAGAPAGMGGSPATIPLGQGGRRTLANRRSAAAARRDSNG